MLESKTLLSKVYLSALGSSKLSGLRRETQNRVPNRIGRRVGDDAEGLFLYRVLKTHLPGVKVDAPVGI